MPVYVNYPATTAIDFYLVDIDQGRVLPENHHCVLPAGAYLRAMSLSHTGKRIAWLFNLKVVLKKDGASKTEDILEIWLSNVDGSDLKRLPGFAPYNLGATLTGEAHPQVFIDCPIRWTVDDKAISCLEGNVLEIVKVK